MKVDDTYFDLAHEVARMLVDDLEKGNEIRPDLYTEQLKDKWDIPELEKVINVIVYIIIEMVEAFADSMATMFTDTPGGMMNAQ